MILSLKRPLLFFDLETTDKNVKDARIVQYCMIKYYPDGSQHQLQAYVNPGVPVSEAATAVHGLTDEMLAPFAIFELHAPQVHEFIQDADIVGYNSNVFDIPILYNELRRCGIQWDHEDKYFIDACNIYKINEPRDLSNAYKHYTGKTLIGSHNAMHDVEATVEVFVHQVERYSLSRDMAELAVYSNYGQKRADLSGCFYMEGDEYYLAFGKHKGKKAADCRDYLQWMLSQDFADDVKRICRTVINHQLSF